MRNPSGTLGVVIAVILGTSIGWIARTVTQPEQPLIPPEMAVALVIGIERSGVTFGEYARQQFANAATCPGAAPHDFSFVARVPKAETLPIAIGITYAGTPDPGCDDELLSTLRYIALVDPVTGRVSAPPKGAEFPTAETWLTAFRT